MSNFLDGVSQGNTEVLWTFVNKADVPGGGGSYMRRIWVNRYNTVSGLAVTAEYGGRGLGRAAITRWAFNLYEKQDHRNSDFAIRKYYLAVVKTATLNIGDTIKCSTGVESGNDARWPSTKKWDWAHPDPARLMDNWTYADQPYLRLADTYLLLAEAQFKQNKKIEAAENINKVRRRSNASEITPTQVTLDYILDERSRELLTEEHRRYTLVRTGTWFDRVKAYNKVSGSLIQPFNALYPIPQILIDANVDLEMPQNPGY